MAKSSFDLKAWALVGAQQRLRDIDQERAAILAAFPQLRGAGRTAGRTAMKRKRRRMSADARRRISEAQKARWAKQKGGKKDSK